MGMVTVFPRAPPVLRPDLLPEARTAPVRTADFVHAESEQSPAAGGVCVVWKVVLWGA
jgi:hypothetical protein